MKETLYVNVWQFIQIYKKENWLADVCEMQIFWKSIYIF